MAKAAVQLLQSKLVQPPTGEVKEMEWKAMMEAMPFGVFDHTDIDETIVAMIEGKTEKQKRKDYQISVIPKADQTFRVLGYGREYPRLSPFHIDHFRRFLARFEPTGSSPRVG